MQAQMIVHRDRSITPIGATCAFIFFGMVLLFLMIAKPAFAAPAFSAQSPANGATLSAAPTSISVSIADTAANLPAATAITAKIDNVTVSAKTLTLSDPKNGVLTMVLPGALMPGLHTVNVSMKSGLTTYASTWSFTLDVQVPVSIWPVAPADASTIDAVHPTVTIKAPANAAAMVTDVTFSVDGGAAMPAVYNATTGVATLDPTVLRFADGGTHTITATVSGAVSGTKTWSFSVARYQPSIPIANLECSQCHDAARVTSGHDMNDCVLCHGPNAPLGGIAYTTADLSNSPHTDPSCAVCHSLTITGCSTCHTTNPTGPGTHDIAAMPAAHTTAATTCSGTNCHSNSLFTEHTANAAGCALCHGAGVDAAVTAVIATGVTDCTGCHGNGPHADVSSNTATCQDCHSKGTTNPKAAPASAQVDLSWWTGNSHDLTGVGNTSASANDASCVLCHDPHVKGDKSMGALSYNQTAPAANAQALCLTCHTASKPAALAGTTVADMSAYATGGHNNSVKCDNCHAVHGSQNASLLAYKVPTLYTPVNGAAADMSLLTDPEALCYKCHGNGEPARNGVNMNIWVDREAANIQPHGGTGTHSSTETIADYATNRHAVCADCHDQHKSTAANKLAGVTGVSYASATGLSSYAVGSGTGTTNDFSIATWQTKWQGTLTPTTIGDGQTKPYADGEWELCLKCHSGSGGAVGSVTIPASGTTAAYTYTRTDLAREFNPNNPSGHRVVATPGGAMAGWGFTKAYTTGQVGLDGNTYNKQLYNQAGTLTSLTWNSPTTTDTNYWWLRTAAQNGTGATASALPITGLTENSVLKCTDCHSGMQGTPKGPHGSTTKYMLDAGWNSREWKTVQLQTMGNTTGANAFICAKCHWMGPTAAPASGTAANGGLGNIHWQICTTSSHSHFVLTCGNCHIAIPHGWKRPRLLMSAEDDAGTPYVMSSITAAGTATTQWGWHRTTTTLNRSNATAVWNTTANNANAASCTKACGTGHTTTPTNYLP